MQFRGGIVRLNSEAWQTEAVSLSVAAQYDRTLLLNTVRLPALLRGSTSPGPRSKGAVSWPEEQEETDGSVMEAHRAAIGLHVIRRHLS